MFNSDLPAIESEFTVDEVGEKTGQRYRGVFKVKRILNKSEEFAADIRRRALLGQSPENATVLAANEAFVMAQLSIRIVKAPSWWDPPADDMSGFGGLHLYDSNVIAKVFEMSMKAEKEWDDEIAAKTKKVEKTIEKVAARPIPVNEPEPETP